MSNSESGYGACTELAWYLIDEVLDIPVGKRFGWQTHLEKELENYLAPDSKEDLFPELKDRAQRLEDDQPPALERSAGTYVNKGYHDIALKYNSKDGCLEVDWSDRSNPAKIRVTEHAYDHWYVAELIDLWTEDENTMKCKFEVSTQREDAKGLE